MVNSENHFSFVQEMDRNLALAMSVREPRLANAVERLLLTRSIDSSERAVATIAMEKIPRIGRRVIPINEGMLAYFGKKLKKSDSTSVYSDHSGDVTIKIKSPESENSEKRWVFRKGLLIKRHLEKQLEDGAERIDTEYEYDNYGAGTADVPMKITQITTRDDKSIRDEWRDAKLDNGTEILVRVSEEFSRDEDNRPIPIEDSRKVMILPWVGISEDGTNGFLEGAIYADREMAFNAYDKMTNRGMPKITEDKLAK